MRPRLNVVACVLLGLCGLLTLQVNRLLQENRILHGENAELAARVILQQQEAVWQMEKRLAVMRPELAAEAEPRVAQK